MRGMPRVIWVLGLASLLNDVSSEAIFPLLPLFLTSLGAPMGFIGLIEGSADALGSVLKVVAGRLSDRGPRKLFVVGGYTIPALARAAISAALAPWHVFAARLLDRTGKGIRSGPRDAMIAESVPPSQRGRAFGLNRSMDHFGAALGPLLASALLWAGRQPAHGVPDRGGDRDDGADRPVLPPARATGRRGGSQRAGRRRPSGDRCGAATRPTWSRACCSRWATRRMRSC